MRQFFQVTKRLIRQKLLDWPRLTGSSFCGERALSTDRGVQFATAQTYVFSDSVLCLGGISDETVKAWESETRYLKRFGSDRRGDDGVRVEIFQRFITLRILVEIQKMMAESKCEPKQFQRNDHLHVNVQWHRLDKTRKERTLYCECSQSYWVCLKIQKLLKAWCSTLPKADILCFVPAAPCKEENGKAKEMEWKTIHLDLCNELAKDSSGAGNPPRMISWNQWWYRKKFLLLTLFLRLMRKYNEICCVNTVHREDDAARKSQNFLNNRNWPNSAPMLVFSDNIDKGQCFITLDEEGLDDMKTSCREYASPRSDETSRARGWIRRNTKIEGLLSLRTSRCWDHDRIFISRPNSFLGSHRERNQPIRNRNVRRNSCCTRWEQRYGEPVAKAKPRPKPTLTFTLVSFPYSERQWIDVDPGKFSQGWFEVSKFMIRLSRHDDTVHREDDAAVRFDDLGFNIVWILTLPNTSPISIQSRDIHKILSLIPHCKTMYCCRMTSPSTSTISGTLTTCTPLFKGYWSQEEKATEGTDSQCSSQPWTRCTPTKIWKKFNTICTKPELRCTQILGEFTKIQYIGGSIWSSRKGLQFCETQSHAIGHTTLWTSGSS